MNPWLGALLSAMAAIASALAEDDLPKPDEGEPLEIEPPLLIQSRGPEGLPNAPALPEQVDLAKLEGDLAKAKKSALSGERLFKAGIIAKVEAEDRALRVVRLEAKLAEARLEVAKIEIEEQNSAPANAEKLMQATQAAERAADARRRAELEAAFRNLQRQQKLLALGSARRADVSRAEKKLVELQGAGN